MEDGKVIHLCSESFKAGNDALLAKCYGIRSTYKSFLPRGAGGAQHRRDVASSEIKNLL